MFYRSLLLATLIATPLYAQSTAESPILPKVIVTATRTAVPIFDIPAAVTLVDENDLNTLQPTTINDTLRDVPNLTSQGGPRSSTEQVNLRGLDDRRILYKVDGQRRNFRGEYKGRFFIDPELIKQVEVVRGANSALDGSGAIAGTIQFITKDAADLLPPDKDFGVLLKAGGDTNPMGLHATTSVFGRDGDFDALASYTHRNHDNVSLPNNVDLNFSDERIDNTLFKLTWTPDDANQIQLTAASYRNQGLTYPNPFREPPNAGSPVDRDAETYDARLRYTYADASNPWVDLTALLYTSRTMIEEITISGSATGRRDSSAYDTYGFDVYNTARFTTGVVNHALTFGSESYYDTQKGARGGAATRENFYPDADTANVAFYAQNEMRFGDFTIIPGLRYDTYSLQGATSSVDNKDDQLSGKLALGYDINQQVALYASLAQAFRAPLLNEAYASGPLGGPLTLLSNPALRPEVSVNKEIGARGQYANVFATDDGFTWAATFFENDVTDLIERQSVTATQFQYRNIPDARLRGVEVEFGYKLFPYEATLALTKTEGDNLTQNQPLLDVPPERAVFTVSRHIDAASGFVVAGWRVEAVGAQDDVPPNDLLVTASDGYTLHDVYMSWYPENPKFDALRIDLRVDNLFDKRYRPVTAFIEEAGRSARLDFTVQF